MGTSIFDYAESCATRLRSMYAEYAKGPVDEGLRQFLRSMSEQEASHLRFIREKVEELGRGRETDGDAGELLEGIGDAPERKDVKTLSRVDFLAHAMEMEEWTMEMYKRVSEKWGRSDEIASLFRSLYEEEKRHLSLVKDRYELESLI